MTPHEWVPLAIGFLQSLVHALAWPVALVWILWRLGPALMQLLGQRDVHVRGWGVTAIITAARELQTLTATGENPASKPPLPPPPPAAQVPAPVPAAAPAAVPGPAPVAPVAVPAREALQAIEQDIQGALNQFAPGAREGALVSALATARLFGQHEFTYNRIFGSQIAGLKALDETGPKTVQQAREFFAPYAALWPQVYNDYSFESWLGFMITSGLVAQNGEVLSATMFGHDFLVYLREARLTESKAG